MKIDFSSPVGVADPLVIPHACSDFSNWIYEVSVTQESQKISAVNVRGHKKLSVLSGKSEGF